MAAAGVAGAAGAGAGDAAAMSGKAEVLIAVIASSKPAFRDAHDAAAFAVHSAVLDAGWHCVALSEKTDEKNFADLGAAPDGWNKHAETYCFVYIYGAPAAAAAARAAAKPAAGAAAAAAPAAAPAAAAVPVAVLKLVRMENALVVHAIRKSDDKKVHTLELTVDDYVASGIDWKAGVSDFSALYKPALSSLLPLLDGAVISKITPPPPQRQPAAKQPVAKPAPDAGAIDPANPLMVPRQPRPVPVGGDFDADWRGPAVPFGPGPLGGGPGNLMGPNHPLFDGRGGRGGGGLGPLGGGRGRGMGPRFDPFGPMPGFGEPDADHFRRPGARGPGNGGPFGGGGGGFM